MMTDAAKQFEAEKNAMRSSFAIRLTLLFSQMLLEEGINSNQLTSKKLKRLVLCDKDNLHSEIT